MITFMACTIKEETEPEVVATEILYTMPEESEVHEGTWLQWPHQYQYGVAYRNSLDPTWVSMTKALITSEKVHIIAYDLTEKDRIIRLTVVGIDVRNLYENGGMVHCVTQQQPQ